jgi:hypothetical protein
MWLIFLRALITSGVFTAAASAARASEVGHHLDLALVLAVDVSSSMNASEQQAQRKGYANAFRDPGIFTAISSGPRGKIAVAYVEWAGPGHQQVRVPWTIISGPRDAAAFADQLMAMPVVVEKGTSISSGLAFAASLLADGPTADRAVVDISGDGPNNSGTSVVPVREALVESGITINGLAISLPRDGTRDWAEAFGPDFTTAYYEDCVIGGPGAFVIPVDHAARFADAIREKLILEIAGRPARVVLAAYRPASRPLVDCATIGEQTGR